MTLPEAVRLARSIQEDMLRAGVLRIANVVTTPERFEALEMVLSACVPCAELTHAIRDSGIKCDEPAKPEVGPMQDAESLSGVQALGSSGLAHARVVIVDLRDHARYMESSLRGDHMWLWRGQAMGYGTALGILDHYVAPDPPTP